MPAMTVSSGCFLWLFPMARSVFRILCRVWLFATAGSCGCFLWPLPTAVSNGVCVSDFVPAMVVSYGCFLWVGQRFGFCAGCGCFLRLFPMVGSYGRFLGWFLWLFPMPVSNDVCVSDFVPGMAGSYGSV